MLDPSRESLHRATPVDPPISASSSSAYPNDQPSPHSHLISAAARFATRFELHRRPPRLLDPLPPEWHSLCPAAPPTSASPLTTQTYSAATADSVSIQIVPTQ